MFTKDNNLIHVGRGFSLESSNPRIKFGAGSKGLPYKLFVLISILWISFSPVFAYALSQDEAIDLAMGALEGPVFHKVLMPYGTQEGAPLFPIYKQQPPAAQQDFRPPAPAPAPATPTTTPAPEPEPATTPTTPTTTTPCVIGPKPC